MNRVTFPLTLQMKRPTVGHLHEALVSLGSTIAEAEKANERYGASTRAAVMQLQTAQKLPATGEVDEATARAINDLLSARGALDTVAPDLPEGPDPAARRVAGTVQHADGSAIAGMPVKAFHRRMGGEVLLGAVATNDRGKFAIAYRPPAGMSNIDLFVRAYDGKEAIVAVSPLIIGARAEEVLDLTVKDATFRGPSEFAQTANALAPHLASAKLEALDADDVALLVRHTGIVLERVTAWIASKRLAHRAGLEHEPLYALVRHARRASLADLLRHSRAYLARALQHAAQANIVSADTGQKAPETIAKLATVGGKLSASAEVPGSIGRLLVTCRKVLPELQEVFLDRYARHTGPVRQFWKALRQDPRFGDEAVDDLQVSLQLGTVTANHAPLVEALRATGIRRASDAARLSPERWTALLNTTVSGRKVGAPANIKGTTESERLRNYVTLLIERTHLAFPTAHVANALKTLPVWKSSAAVAFLDANPDFNVATADIRTTLESAKDVATLSGKDRDELERELAIVQRVTRLAPPGTEEQVVGGLLAHGYQSAFAISRTSRDAFTRRTMAALGSRETAIAVHHNAQFQVSRTLSAYSLMHPAVSGPIVKALGRISEDVSTDATWASLFGHVDYCACEHCRSIYSPAAYLVDLLAWLDGRVTGQKTAFEHLDARRPDIKRIQLTCENTNTLMPYADLVSEILEVRILNPRGTDSSAPSGPQASTAASAELLANPEYLHAEVYDGHLGRAVFPHQLPFDLWGALARVYFDHLGVRRSDLMEAMEGRVTLAINAERLGLSPAEWSILTGQTRHDVWALWGLRSEKPEANLTTLANVTRFLDRARIDYPSLLDLLHSRFANTKGISISGPQCDTDAMTLAGLNDDDLLHMQQLLRLWRHRGGSMLDLDKTLHALGIAALDSAGLGRLADLDRVLTRTNAPLLDVLSWWSLIDTFHDRPEKEAPVKALYDRVYLNRAVDAEAEAPDFPLALNTARNALARDDVPWDALGSQLQAALQIDAAALALLIGEKVNGLSNPHRVVAGVTATLEGLSALYRHVSLARALKLTVKALVRFLRLTGINPFDRRNTAATVQAIETIAAVRTSGFSLDHLHYFLEHDTDAETRVGVTDDAIGRTLVEMRDDLARIESDFAATTDPTGAVTARFLAVLLSADAAAAVMTALQTPADGTNNAALATVVNEHLGTRLGLTAAELIAQPIERRLDEIVSALGLSLQETQCHAVVIEKAATFTVRDLDSVEDLLSRRMEMTVGERRLTALAGLRKSPYAGSEGGEISPADDREAFATLKRLHKTATVLAALGNDLDEQIWLFDVGVANGLLNPTALPIVPTSTTAAVWSGWTRLVDLFALRRGLPGGEPRLADLLRLLESADGPGIADDVFRSALVSRTGWLRTDLDTLIAKFGLAFPNDWRDGRALARLVEAFALVRRTGTSAAQAYGWATAPIGVAQAEELRLAAKSKHDEVRWPGIARALRDPVRERQREALVAFLTAHDARYPDEARLYADLLIDVEMAPRMLTSRIKQAISSVQLFVQRAFLNLENGVELTRDDREQWEWMKNYRVWEAARKVFLYPENWTEPELRPDKSALFDDFESALQQDEVVPETVEKAYTAYLEGLVKVSRLEVMGTYHQIEEHADAVLDELHVVARTKGQPHEYFYRRLVDGREWTPWEKLDADIEGDHVILAVHDRRLFLFWPVVVQKAESDGVSSSNFFEMKLAWIERQHQRWGGRKLSDGFLKMGGRWDQLDLQAIGGADSSFGGWATYFRLADRHTLAIECRQSPDPSVGRLMGTFVWDRSTGSMLADDFYQPPETTIVLPSETSVRQMRLAVFPRSFDPMTTLSLMSGAVDGSGRLTGGAHEVEVLGRVSAPTYAYPHQYGEFASQDDIFLDDDTTTFHVTPVAAFKWEEMFEEDALDLSSLATTVSAHDVFVDLDEKPPFTPDVDWEPPDVGPRDELPPRRISGFAGTSTLGFEPLPASALGKTLTAHDLRLSQAQLDQAGRVEESLTLVSTSKYRFALFAHPYAREFMAEVRRSGVCGLLDPSPDGPARNLARQQQSVPDFFVNGYEPTPRVLGPYPAHDIDFAPGSAYAEYNWELFFHIPFLVAARLSRNRRFEDAQRWFHFIFDPTNRSHDEDPLRFWKIKPFYRKADAPIRAVLALAASSDGSSAAVRARREYDEQVEVWTRDPFNPHTIARLRTTAYQKAVVMKYLDNLIAWGDSLFRQDSIESINEATQLYVLALELLGERPDALPPRREPQPRTFEGVRADLEASALNNPLVALENATPRAATVARRVSSGASAANALANLLVPRPGTGPTFYFCIPPNDTLLGYWDVVENRLFKIRHCMNIEGIVRQLPLFEPPIDPGLLVRARAARVDLSSALADLNAPLPHYRFTAMLQKAYALNQTVRGLGSALLSALEKSDAEALAILRANHEVAVLEAVRQVKTLAIEESSHALAAAEGSLEVVKQRRGYYGYLIETGWLPQEKSHVGLLLAAGALQAAASTVSLVGTALAPLPRVDVGMSGVNPTVKADVVDGAKLAKATELASGALGLLGNAASLGASVLGVTAAWQRRTAEWEQQAAMADKEIKQIDKQIEAARVRVALAERDRDNHDRQIENARSVRELLEQKFTNVELYQWMVGQLSSLCFQSYQLAYDLAKQAERAYRHELALPRATFIQFGYWDSLKKGLLAGERLQYDLERMDKAYLENNRREYEITKHVSLALLDPVALLQLQTAGACEFSVREAVFDIDCPGHYLRRIKSVGVTVPCVTGPYTGVPMRLTLVSSRTRVDPSATDHYPMDLSIDDERFQLHTGAVQSIVISGGREDAGVFAADLRDERYLPFEASGAISEWSLKLTSAVPTFDWTTITDVVLHIRYTAREGGGPLREAALASLNSELSALPLRRAFSARSEFPSEWNAFLRPAEGSSQAVLSVGLGERLFPRIAHEAGLKIISLEVVARLARPEGRAYPTTVTIATADDVQTAELTGSSVLHGGQPSASATYASGAAPGTWEVSVPIDPLGAPSAWVDDLILIATYQLELQPVARRSGQ